MSIMEIALIIICIALVAFVAYLWLTNEKGTVNGPSNTSTGTAVGANPPPQNTSPSQTTPDTDGPTTQEEKVDLMARWWIGLLVVGILLVATSILFGYKVTLLWPYTLTILSLVIGRLNGNAGQIVLKTSLVLLLGSLIKIISDVFFGYDLENLGGWYWLPFAVISLVFIDYKGNTPGIIAASWLLGFLLPFTIRRGPYMNIPGISENIGIPHTPQTTKIFKPDDIDDWGMEFFVKYDKVVASLIGISAKDMMSDTEEVKAELKKLNYVRGSLLPCNARITYQWRVVDAPKALSFLNATWDSEIKWDEAVKKFEIPVLSFVKGYLRPTINGTDFDDLLESETQDRINGKLDNVDHNKNVKENNDLRELNEKLLRLFGVKIMTFNLEKAKRNEEIERLVEAVSKESFQRIQELKDADTQAELTRYVIVDVLGYESTMKWKDLDESVRLEVSQRVLQIQEKLTAGDTAIANAIRSFFDRTGIALSPKSDGNKQGHRKGKGKPN